MRTYLALILISSSACSLVARLHEKDGEPAKPESVATSPEPAPAPNAAPSPEPSPPPAQASTEASEPQGETAEDRAAAMKAKQEKEAAEKALREEWGMALRFHTDALRLLQQVADGSDRAVVITGPKYEVKKVGRLGEMAEACEKFRDTTFEGMDPAFQPSVACANVAKADELFMQHINNSAKHFMASIQDEMSSYLRLIEENGSTYERYFNVVAIVDATRSNAKQKLDELYGLVNATPPDELLTPFDGIPKRFDAAIAVALTKKPELPNKNYKDRAVEGAVRKQFTDGKLHGRGYKVSKIWTESDAWTIEYSYGTPVSRWKNGAVLVQLDKESFCRFYKLTVEQAYTGAGHYQAKAQVSVNDLVTVARCK